MNFSYYGSGVVAFQGCSKYRNYDIYPYKFRIGEVTYYKQKALRGKLEKIIIKNVKIVRSKGNTKGKVVFVYQDTLNSLYNEWDLLYKNDAIKFANEYYQKNNSFTYIGSGKIKLTSSDKNNLPAPVFSVGSILYLRTKAEHGKLEKVVIQEIRKINNKKTNGQTVFMYIDTLQSIYNQYDLVTETEALIMAKTYFEAQAEIARNAINPCRDW